MFHLFLGVVLASLLKLTMAEDFKDGDSKKKTNVMRVGVGGGGHGGNHWAADKKNQKQ